jgi:hypothetical protein
MKGDQLLLLFPLYFVGIWLAVGFVLSRMGWHGFAQSYPCSSAPNGRSFNCRHAWFGSILASYNNVVRVGFSEGGIYVHALFFFRAFHPPFLVPWANVVGVIEKKRFWITSHELELRDGANELHVVLSDDALREFHEFSKT